MVGKSEVLSMSERAILHVDMDAFFAAIEVLDNPELRGKPVVVGGAPEKRGVIAAASYEARKYGVHSAMSSFRAKKLCPQAIFVKPRGRRYMEISNRIFEIFRSYTPLVEPISIDEAFLDVTGCRQLFGDAVMIGRQIKQRILDEVGLVASVGVAPNKFLAKLASDLEKPDGFCIIKEGEAEALLAELPIGRLWGIGKKSQQKMAKLGVHKIGDLFTLSREKLEAHFGIHTSKLLRLAKGIDNRPVVTDREAKSIGAETTFPKDISDSNVLCAHIDRLVERISKRLRKDLFLANTVQLKARYADFTTVTRAITLAAPTCSTKDIQKAARELLLKRLGRKGRSLRLIGVSLSNLVPQEEETGELFRDPAKEQAAKVDRVLDSLQKKFGSKVIRRGPGKPEPPEDED
jgi:DNA polymerase-4